MLKYDVAYECSVTVITLIRDITLIPDDDFDLSVMEIAPDAANEILELANRIDPPLLIVELVNIPYVTSALVGFYVRLELLIRKRNGRFGVCHAPSYMSREELRRVANVEPSVLDLFKSRADAIASFIASFTNKQTNQPSHDARLRSMRH